MQLDLDDDETRAVLNLLIDALEADHYPLAPRVELRRRILAKFGEVGGLPPDLAQKLRRYAPPPPVRLPSAEERDPRAGSRVAVLSDFDMISKWVDPAQVRAAAAAAPEVVDRLVLQACAPWRTPSSSSASLQNF